MNKPALLLLLILGMTSLTAFAESVGTISTLTGRVYRHCQIIKVHPDGISFTHANGAAKVLFMDLPEEIRVKLGYDEARAVLYEHEIAERRQHEADARAARQAELGKAIAIAQEMELNRLRLAQQEALAMIQAASANNGAFGYSYPVLPVLGAVWDGHAFRNQYRSGGFGVWRNDGRWNQSGWGFPFGTCSNFGTRGFCQPGAGVRACNIGRPGHFIFQTTP